MSAKKEDHDVQTVLGSSEVSRQSASDGEADLVQLSLIASLDNLQSGNDTPLDLLDESELLPLKINQSTNDAARDLLDEIQQSVGVKAETVEPLSIASPSDLQSASDFLDPSEELPLTLQQKEVISRRHHLKFITGHYGTGKVTVSFT